MAAAFCKSFLITSNYLKIIAIIQNEYMTLISPNTKNKPCDCFGFGVSSVRLADINVCCVSSISPK